MRELNDKQNRYAGKICLNFLKRQILSGPPDPDGQVSDFEITDMLLIYRLINLELALIMDRCLLFGLICKYVAYLKESEPVAIVVSIKEWVMSVVIKCN